MAVSLLPAFARLTAPLAVVTFGQVQFRVFCDLIGAAVVIVSIPIAALVLFAQRRTVTGLTAGSFR